MTYPTTLALSVPLLVNLPHLFILLHVALRCAPQYFFDSGNAMTVSRLRKEGRKHITITVVVVVVVKEDLFFRKSAVILYTTQLSCS